MGGQCIVDRLWENVEPIVQEEYYKEDDKCEAA